MAVPAKRPGGWLEREFLAAGRLGRVERNGYRFWGPVVAAILVTQLLGALAYFAGRIVSFPGLLYTVRKLERRLHWVAAVVVAGLAVLLVHLALYPWPDLVRESTSYAGVGRGDAVAAAEKRVAAALSFRSADRGEFGDQDAWLITLEPARGFGSGCVVAVRKAGGRVTATPAPPCHSCAGRLRDPRSHTSPG